MEPNIEHRDLNFDATENNRQAVKEETIGFCDLLFGASPFFWLVTSLLAQYFLQSRCLQCEKPPSFMDSPTSVWPGK